MHFNHPTDHTRLAWLQGFVGIGGILLFASTWRLWIPTSDFPLVPLIYAAGDAPLWLQRVLAVAVPFTLLVTAVAPTGSSWSHRALLTFVAVYAGLVIIDQQRLQPWAYQLAIMAVVLATAGPAHATKLLRILIVCIYAYSAIAKLDHSFLHTVGSQFIDQLGRFLHLPTDEMIAGRKAALALVFPLAELMIAVSLAVPRLRLVGLVISIAMHLAVLLVVGPLGLNHKPAVLIWNVFFLVQNVLLFSRSKYFVFTQNDHEKDKQATSRRLASFAVAIAILLPLLEPLGLCDHWLAWGLYAPRASRVNLYIHDSAAESLPDDLLPQLEPDNDTDWRQIYLDRWSLAERDVPIYPQARVQLGLAEAVVRQNSLERAFQIIRFGAANRRTGERTQEVIRTRAELDRAAAEYLLNARPTMSRRN